MKGNPRVIIAFILLALVAILIGFLLPRELSKEGQKEEVQASSETREVKLIDTWWRESDDYQREFVCIISGDTVKGVEPKSIVDLLVEDGQFASAEAVINAMNTCLQTLKKDKEIDQVRMELTNKENGVIEIRYDYFGL